MSAPARLITIRISHFCEKARWALLRAGLPFVEEAHVPGWHRPIVRRLGGHGTTPLLLLSDGRVLADSTLIVELADQHSGGRLFGSNAQQRREVQELEVLLGRKLGPHTRRLAYFHCLQRPRTLWPGLTEGVAAGERLALLLAMPALRFALRRGLKIDQAGAERSRDYIWRCFDEMAQHLDDGRPYLSGETFTAADLTFAALAAPVVFPAGYGAELPPLHRLSREHVDEVLAFRAHPAGQHALRMYRNHRVERLG